MKQQALLASLLMFSPSIVGAGPAQTWKKQIINDCVTVSGRATKDAPASIKEACSCVWEVYSKILTVAEFVAFDVKGLNTIDPESPKGHEIVMQMAECMTGLSLSEATVSSAPSHPPYVPRLEGKWKVVGFKFAAISAMSKSEANSFLGKYITKDKGSFYSPWFDCGACGLAEDYKVYSTAEFVTSEPDYAQFKILGAYVADHVITFEDKKLSEVHLITVNDHKTGYFLWDGVYFELKRQ